MAKANIFNRIKKEEGSQFNVYFLDVLIDISVFN